MAKAKKNSEEQLDLIDVHPENEKAIVSAAKMYKKYQAARLGALAKEVEQKKLLLSLIRDAKLKPLDDGRIKFSCDNFVITVTPADMKINVKEKDESSGKE